METASSKHRNLQHTLNDAVKEQALKHLGEGAEAGLRILELRQRDMQELFGKIFGVPTKSSNNEWLRSKLLQAVGLPPRWRPAPTPPPSPPRDGRAGEYSRFGRRLRATTASPLDSASDAEEEEEEEGRQPQRKRPRHASRSASPADQQQQQQQQALAPASPAVSASAPQAPFCSAAGTAAILSLQARAAAAFASLPSGSACQPLILHPAAPCTQQLAPAVAQLQMQSQLLTSFELPSLELPPLPPLAAPQQPAAAAAAPLAPATTAAQEQLSLLRYIRVPVPPQCAPSRSHALAALLSDADHRPPSPVLLPPVPTLRPCMPSITLSAQLHNLYGEWEEGLLSFGPSASLLHCLQ